MIQLGIVKTLVKGITDATKLLRTTIYGVCSEAIESYSENAPNDISIKSNGYFNK